MWLSCRPGRLPGVWNYTIVIDSCSGFEEDWKIALIPFSLLAWTIANSIITGAPNTVQVIPRNYRREVIRV